MELRGAQPGAHPPRPEGPDQRPILEHFAGAIQVCWRSLRVAPFLDIWPVVRRVARILLAFRAFFVCVDLMLTTTIFGPMSTIFASLKGNEEQLCVTRLVAWKSSPKNGLVFGSENWFKKSAFWEASVELPAYLRVLSRLLLILLVLRLAIIIPRLVARLPKRSSVFPPPRPTEKYGSRS